ncbi:MAG: cell division protein ZapB [Nitrospiraceae bacterium]|nr:MAG: cell division protein ZapB [Nitrospiraceae bacterium]
MIIYLLMQEGLFNFFKEGTSVEKIQMLEDKIAKVIDRIKALSQENEQLNVKIGKLQDEMTGKDEEIATLRRDLKNAGTLKTDIEKLNSERETVKSQLESLIKELESVEL